MSMLLKPRLMVLSIGLLLSVGVAAGTDDLHTAKKTEAVTESTVTVTANVLAGKAAAPFNASSHYGSGFSLTPTGNGSSGRLYATANRDPAAVLSNNPGSCTSECCSAGPNVDGEPILTASGTKVEAYPLFALPGEMGLRFILYYQGYGWHNNLDYSLDVNCDENPPSNGICKTTTLRRPDGSRIRFSGGSKETAYVGGGITTLTRDANSGVYTLHDEDVTTQTYSPSGVLTSITDASGIGWKLTYANGTTTVTHTSGQSFSLKEVVASNSPYQATQTVSDPAGNVFIIQKGAGSLVNSVTYPGSPATVMAFKYVGFSASPYGYALSEVAYNGVTNAYTTYDTQPTLPNSKVANIFYRRATGTYLADGSERVSIAYNGDNTGKRWAVVTGPLGNQVTKNFDANGNITLISGTAVQTCGATVSGRSYDANGNLAVEIDNNGNTHTYTYASNGQLQTETEAAGTPIARTTDYVWDANRALNRLLSVTVRGWKKTTYTYDARNRLATASETNLASTGTPNETITTNYTYVLYPSGMVLSMLASNPTTGITTYSYDSRGNLTSVSNTPGQKTSYSNYNGIGQPGRTIGPNGDITDITYDARGRVTAKTTYPGGVPTTWAYTYDGFGLLYTLKSPDGQVMTWNRDRSTMRVSTINRNDKDGASVESFAYNANGDVTQHKISRGGTNGFIETSVYDALGRIYQRTGQNGQLVSYTYDGNGNTLSATDASGHRIRYEYDALDRLVKRTEDDVLIPPAVPSQPPTIQSPASSANGTYNVTWNTVSGASSYPLQLQTNGGAWSALQGSAGTSWAANSQPSGTYGYRVQACNVSGCSVWSTITTTTVANIDPTKSTIGINGKTYTSENWVKAGSGNTAIGFDIASGKTWQVTRSLPGNAHEVLDSGALPTGAVSVQYTWTDAGVYGGEQDARGAVTNPAVTPVPVTGSLWTFYTTASFNWNQPEHNHQYRLKVDFFDASGRLISSSTCLMQARVQGNA